MLIKICQILISGYSTPLACSPSTLNAQRPAHATPFGGMGSIPASFSHGFSHQQLRLSLHHVPLAQALKAPTVFVFKLL
jgi:hypothetical protein